MKENEGVPLSEASTEGFQTNEAGNWETIPGSKHGAEVDAVQINDKEGIVVSPSRFSPLLGIDEEDAEENEEETMEVNKELEDGEISEGKLIQRPDSPPRKTTYTCIFAESSEGCNCSSKGSDAGWQAGGAQKNFR